MITNFDKEDVAIMDNMHSHYAKIVTELFDKAGISYMYLSPYNPDLNSIEKMWLEMKAILRKRKICVTFELSETVNVTLKAISASDCKP
ncbi:transposase [Blautia wexlerae]|uniref:transposase n=1 Tax=Blautia wexlerae TaxID=418240 RepID=UPI002418A967|nr:transposase [Blautia wexlerae]